MLTAEKSHALEQVLKNTYTAKDIQDKIKNNEMPTFKEFVRRLKITQTDPNATKDMLVQQLSECLITEDGKRRASQILGIKTFKDMYHKPSRSSSQRQ